ncbi:hypothetical protein [Thalassotalea ganghwensis]
MKNLIVIGLLTLALLGCKTSQAIYNVKSTLPVNTDSPVLKKAIHSALAYKRWRVISESESEIVAGIDVRNHYAEITITLHDDHYKVNYKDSHNLDYKEHKASIHRNYNKWIKLLVQEIDRSIQLAN